MGFEDRASTCQLTVMDDATVVENRLTARDVDVVNGLTVNDLVVKGSINTDNASWDSLTNKISSNMLEKITQEWQDSLIEQIVSDISSNGINFTNVKINNELLVDGNQLNTTITQTNIKKLGTLSELQVQGPTNINNTVGVINQRLGINTQEPESALSVWDEEVAVVINKFKLQEAYIGTARPQSLNIGVNRTPQITVDIDGITTIKKLRVGQHQIGHGTKVPNYSGTRGDIVFNSDPNDTIFAWVCLGAFKWKTLKAVE